MFSCLNLTFQFIFWSDDTDYDSPFSGLFVLDFDLIYRNFGKNVMVLRYIETYDGNFNEGSLAFL